MDTAQSRTYKHLLTEYYSRRSAGYDTDEWHGQIARKLVDLSDLRAGANVLDVCTGTGMIALYAAIKVGASGAVLGIDISAEMLKLAYAKSVAAGIAHVRFEIADAEQLRSPSDHFDNVYCGSAFILMTDLLAALTHWKALLKPHGQLGFQAFSDHSFVCGVLARSVFAQYGVDYRMNRPTGSVGKCRALLAQAGYRDIHIEVDAASRYISLQDAIDAWMDTTRPAPGQFPHPLAKLTPEQMSSARIQYVSELEKLATTRGIEDDMTTYYVFARK